MFPSVSMMIPDAVACSSAAVTSMRTTDGAIARAVAANARDNARASEGTSVRGVRRSPASGNGVASTNARPSASIPKTRIGTPSAGG